MGRPAYVGLDCGIHKDIARGSELSYRSDSKTYGSNKYKSSAIGIGVNGNSHFNSVMKILSKWDLYAGLGLNYYIGNYYSELYKTNDNSDIGFGAQIRRRYFFTDKFGIQFRVRREKWYK